MLVIYLFCIQKDNPFLRLVTLVPVQFCSIVPDFIIGKSTCCLFLSLKYYGRYPEYIKGRFLELLHSPYRQRTSASFPYKNCFLLCLVDTNNANAALAMQELNLVCVKENVTLMLAWRSDIFDDSLSIFIIYAYLVMSKWLSM